MQLKHFVKTKYQTDIRLNLRNVMFNSIHEKDFCVLNTSVLLMKQNIYVHRCLGTNLSFEKIEYKIRELEQIELSIAMSRDKLDKHLYKWSSTHTNDGSL